MIAKTQLRLSKKTAEKDYDCFDEDEYERKLSQKLLNPEDFKEEMKKLKEGWEYNKEDCHTMMDILLCKTLEKLGYGEGIKIFEDTGKWYS